MSCCWCLQLYVSLLLTLHLMSDCSSWVSTLRSDNQGTVFMRSRRQSASPHSFSVSVCAPDGWREQDVTWRQGCDILISERIWCQVQHWPQRFNPLSVSQPGAEDSNLWGLWESKSPSHGRGKLVKSNPTYLIQGMRGGKEKGRKWWVQTQAVEALLLGLKSSGGACPWSKMLWNKWDPFHSPLRGGQVNEIQAHVNRQKDLIGIRDFEVLNPS